MEGQDEKKWRLDAAWAIAAIIAVALYLGLNVYNAIAAAPADSAPREIPYTELLLYQKLISIIIWIFLGGGILFFFYTLAEVFRVRLFLRPEEQPTTWTLWDVGKGATATYLSSLVLTTFAIFPEGMFYREIYGGYLLHGALWLFASYFAATSGGSQKAMGFTLRGFPLNVLHGILAYIATLPFFYIAMAISLVASYAIHYYPQENPLVPMMKEVGPGWVQWAIILLITVFGPLTEEIFFRGFLYPALRRKLTILPAVLINGALFALIHFSFMGFLPIMVLGMSMAYLFEKSRSLVPCTTLHIAHNTLEVLLVFYAVGT